jgi:cell division initiation protein
VEVDNFLDLVAGEFEELLKENSQIREEERRKLARINELEVAEKELRDTLVSAQRIAEEMKNNARKEGDLIIEEAKLNARKIVESGRAQALELEAKINQLKHQKGQFEAALKATIEMHQRLLESTRDESGKSESAEAE